MKVSVSLPGEDVQFLDAYALEQGLGSRSSALQRAVRLLRIGELGAAYEAAWQEGGPDSPKPPEDPWDATVGDGIER